MLKQMEHPPLTESVYYILLSLEKPRHGYAIMQYVADLSESRVKMGPGTLYGALKTLLEKDWIKLLDENAGARKKEYVLTELGREIVLNEIARLEELITNGKKIMRGENNEN